MSTTLFYFVCQQNSVQISYTMGKPHDSLADCHECLLLLVDCMTKSKSQREQGWVTCHCAHLHYIDGIGCGFQSAF